VQLTRLALSSILVAAALVLAPAHAVATPVYAAREGRACDNCHVSPNRWENPKLADRKCSLACQTCHVDPAGGGMRTVTGRFFGRATLPMIATSPRPTVDWDRNLPWLGRRDRATSYNANIPYGPATLEASRAYRDSVGEFGAWGTPRGETPHAPFPGRYGTLRADPVVRVGGDVRMAALFTRSTLVFPMQFDIGAAVHPVHHATVLANVGARGQSSGYSATIDDSHTPYFRELFVMTHEWPFQAYAKAGRFVPSYGLRLDDHTNRIRREFELDGSLVESRVTGVEVGAAPNYPFVHASWFQMTSKYEEPDAWDIFDLDEGWGAALNLGFRELGWSVGASALARRRPLGEGGDTDTYGVYGVLNPWFYRRRLPLTLQGEVDMGTYQRQSGLEASRLVWYGEVDWSVRNGVNLLFAYDWTDPDRDVIDDHSGRYQLGVQLIPYPGITLDGRVRALDVATSSGDDVDLFLQLHFWF
jgi:hypothetical protein